MRVLAKPQRSPVLKVWVRTEACIWSKLFTVHHQNLTTTTMGTDQQVEEEQGKVG